VIADHRVLEFTTRGNDHIVDLTGEVQTLVAARRQRPLPRESFHRRAVPGPARCPTSDRLLMAGPKTVSYRNTAFSTMLRLP
jgi:hypothetical protein